MQKIYYFSNIIDMKKEIFVVIIAAFIFAIFAFDLQQYINFDYLKLQQNFLQAWYGQNTFLAIAIFVFVYLLVTAMSLPTATALSLLGGAIFGFNVAIVLVCFAGALGATLAFLLARFLFKDFIAKKYTAKLAIISREFAKGGVIYLLALRLTPIIPFFLVNIFMSLMPIRVYTFYFVSLIGMLPLNIFYVYVGEELAQINSIADVASLRIFMGLFILGLFLFCVGYRHKKLQTKNV